MNYADKKVIADVYLLKKCGLTWDDLADINSLHDVEDREGIYELCDERLAEVGFPEEDK